MIVLQRARQHLLGRQLAARQHLERDDDRDRQGATRPHPRGEEVAFAPEWARIGVFGAGWSASSPPPASPSSATTSSSATSFPSGSRISAGACPSTSGPRGAPREEPGADVLHARPRRGDRGRESCSFASASAHDVRGGRRPLRASGASSTSCGAPWAARPRHEEHRAGRDGREGEGRARPAWARPARLRVVPRVPRGGTAVRDFPEPDRVVSAPSTRTRPSRRRTVRSLRRAGSPDGRGVGRDGEARLERLPRHEDLLHQRDRERLRGVGADVAAVAVAWASTADRPAVPARRDRLRRRASRRTRSRSSSSPATRVTTSSCSTR